MGLSCLLGTTSALACTCAPMGYALEDSFQNAKAVFLGIPNDSQMGPDERQEVVTDFKIVSSFKLPEKETDAETLTLLSRRSSAACGIRFQRNSGLYLIFAYEGEKGLQTSLCSAAVVTPQYRAVTEALRKLPDLANK